MAKQQEKPKSILNVFFKGGTRAKIGLKLEASEVNNKFRTMPEITLESTNEDETVESEMVTIIKENVIFYSIQTPRFSSDLVLADAGSIPSLHQ